MQFINATGEKRPREWLCMSRYATEEAYEGT